MATKEKKESWKPRKESGNGKGKRKRRGSEEDDIVMIDPLVVKGNGKGEEKKKKKKMEEAVQKEEEGVVPALEKEGNDVDIDKTADWCLVCKDGGTLRICDYPKCGKVYHFSCLKKSISFMRSDAYWQCPRHTCYRCQGTAIVSCYCCPSAACSNCFRDAEFVCIGDENGFCKKCMKFVLHFEKKTRRKPSDESTSYEDFMEYYEAVKKKSGFTLNDIQAAFKGLKSRGKRKSSTLFKAEVTERLGGLQKMRSDSSKTPWDEENPLSDIIMVPSLVAENVKIIYLTRSVIEKLLRQPESFEDKVKGSFVGVDFPRKGNPNKVDRQLLQVIGIAKTLSHDGQMSIKLQAKNMPNGISIDMVSNLDFRENLCKDLRQKVEDGLIEMPAIEELERKAEVLSEDIVDDLIARDMKRLQQDSDTANEKGLRQKFFRLEDKRKMLETPSERVRLIRTYQRVISEVRNKSTMLEDTVKEAKGINGSPDTFTLCESVKIPSETVVSRDCNKAPVVALPVLEEGRVRVHKPVSRAPPSLTAKTRVNSNQQFLEVKHKDVIPEQHGHGERPTMRQPVALAAEETQTEQQLMHLTSSSGYCRRISSKGQQSDVEGCICEGNRNLEQAAGSMVDQAQENDEELITVADDSNLQSVSWESECNILPPSWEGTEDQKRFDVMNEEFVISATESSAKVLAVKNNLAKMDDQQRSLKGMVKESSPYMTAAELARMVEKIDEINDQIKNMKVDMEQSVEGSSLVSYNKKSEISLMDLFKLLEPVANLACTKTLEEIKAKHFPDLDLKQFPIYDPTVTERVSPVFRGTIESFINEGLALSQVKVDAEESLVLQPLASEHPEVTKKVNLPAQ